MGDGKQTRNDQSTASLPSHCPGVLDLNIEVIDKSTRRRGEFSTRRGQDHVAGGSEEKRNAELFFELQNQPAHRGLGDSKVGRRSRKAPIQRDRVHRPDMFDGNVKSLWGPPCHDSFHIGIN